MRRVLMIAWYFPPVGGPGTQRTSKYCKYLPTYGWQPIVLAGVDPSEHQDPSLLGDISPEVEVHRLGRPSTWWRRTRKWLFIHRLGLLGNQIGHWLDFPDTMREWAERVVDLAVRLYLRHSFDVIYTTSFPYSAHFAGLRIKRQLDLPWVADLRDPWSKNILLTELPTWMKMRHAAAERRVLGKADTLTVVNEGMRERLVSNGVIGPDLCKVITNGFDPDDYEAVNLPANHSGFGVLVTHTGSFYEGYTPQRLFEALEHSWEHLPQVLRNVCFRFVGGVGPCFLPNVPYPEIQIVDRVSAPDAIAHQKAADVLLIIHDRRTKIDAGYFPGKFFGYLASNKPILAIVPTEGDLARKIRDWNLGWVADPDRPDEIIECLVRVATEAPMRSFQSCLTRAKLDQYSRRKLTNNLAEILDALVGDSLLKNETE